MYTRFEPTVALTMTWLARISSAVVAGVLLVLAARNLFKSDFTPRDVAQCVGWFMAAATYATIWKFEAIGALLSVFAALALLSYGSAAETPTYVPLALLVPTLLALGAWMRRTEYHIMSKYHAP